MNGYTIGIIFLAAAAFILAFRDDGRDINTISYFESNESERVEKIAWCKDSFGRLEKSVCKNALEAEKRTQEKTETNHEI